MKKAPRRLLVSCYGNLSRGDDGLGPRFADALLERAPEITVEVGYQLALEDAATIADYDIVVFVDAAIDATEGFYLRRIQAEPKTGFSSHSVRPGHLLALSEQLFDARPEAFALGIGGIAFGDFAEQLSETATRNLSAALDHFLAWYERSFCSQPDTQLSAQHLERGVWALGA